MIAPRLVVIADAAEVGGSGGAQLAFDLGKLARACRDGGVAWGLWLRAHRWSASRWAATVQALAWVRALGGSIGVSAPAEGPSGWPAAGLGTAGVDRVHVPAAQWADWQRAPLATPCWVACHAAAEVDRALSAGASAAVLSPIWATASKPGTPALGLEILAAACAAHPGRVVALGGIDAAAAPVALGAGAAGVAALSAWRTDAAGLAAAVASAGRMV